MKRKIIKNIYIRKIFLKISCIIKLEKERKKKNIKKEKNILFSKRIFSEKIMNEVIYEYEKVLIGNQKTFSSYFFRFSETQNEKIALSVFRYAFDTYLKWSPEQLQTGLTMEIISRLKLNMLLKYIIYPPEADKTKDVYPIITKLYPGRFKENIRDNVRRVYNRILNGEKEKFPKEFFEGNKGKYKALLCFQYMLNGMPPFASTKELYQTFVGPSGAAILRKHKLYAVCSGLFEYPLDFLHAALPNSMKNEYYYHYYRFLKTRKFRRKQ